MYTSIYAILHFLMDGICMLAMYGWLTKSASEHWLLLVFFFCAYVLQLPFGILADHMIRDRKIDEQEAFMARFCWLGILLTIAGACSTPVILGVGSALFHIGSTGGVILEDRNRGWKGSMLGLYLAPGLAGEYVAQQYVPEYPLETIQIVFLIACGGVVLCIAAFEICMLIKKKRQNGISHSATVPVEMVRLPEKKKWDLLIAACCFIVAVLHFNLGETMEFSWKSGITLGLLGVCAVMAGKIIGGIVNAKIGPCETMFISMLAASVLFCMGNFAFSGLLAFMAYNMLVPVTVYIMEEQFPTLPGLTAGLLGAALFPGYLPSWMKVEYTFAGVRLPHSLLGSLSSMFFLALLLLAGWLADRE